MCIYIIQIMAICIHHIPRHKLTGCIFEAELTYTHILILIKVYRMHINSIK